MRWLAVPTLARRLAGVLVAGVLAAGGLATGIARADDIDRAFRDGLAAFNEGDYARARAAWEPIAADGEPRAASGLGFMYYSGRGVARDSVHAAQLFRQAGDQGEPTAQLFLALMYHSSDGVPPNPPMALMWVELAIAGGQSGAFEWRSTIIRSLSEAQRQEGWRLVIAWRESHRNIASKAH
jgi:TPR repeat protein